MTFSLAIHGGAGTIRRETIIPEIEAGYHAGLRTSLLAGHRVLAAGASAAAPEPEPSWLAELPAPINVPAPGPATADETMADVMRDAGGSVRATVTRITEQLQSDMVLMLKLKRAGIQPGREVLLGTVEGGVRVRGEDGTDPMAPTDLSAEIASHVFVSRE